MDTQQEKVQVTLSLKDKMTSALKKIEKQNTKLAKSFKSDFSAGLQTANTQADKLLNVFGQISKVVAGIGTIAIGGIATTGLKNYANVDQALATTSSTGGFSIGSDEYNAIKEASESLATSTTKTQAEVLEAMEKMYLAGWDTEMVTASIGEAIKFAEANAIDTVTSIDLLTDSLNPLGLGIDDISELLDQLTLASMKANATAQQYLETMLLSSAALNSVNTNPTEQLALAGVLANSGFKGSEAGTTLKMLSNRLYKSTGEGALGLSMLDISPSNEDGTVKSLPTLLEEMAGALSGRTEAEINEALSYAFGQYKAQGLALLSSFAESKQEAEALSSIISDMGEELAEMDGVDLSASGDYFELLDTILNESSGAVEQKYSTMTDTLSNDLGILKNSFANFSASFMEGFGSDSRGLIQSLTAKLNEMSESARELGYNLSEKFKNVFQWLIDHQAEIMNALGGILAFFISFIAVTKGITIFQTLQKGFKYLLVVFELIQTGGLASTLGAMFAPLLANPYTAIIIGVAVAIGLIVVGLVKLYKHSEKFREFCNTIAENFKNTCSIITDKFKEVYNEYLKPIWELIKGLFVDETGEVHAIWVFLGEVLVGTIASVVQTILNVIVIFVGWFVNMFEGICDALSGVVDFIAGVFTGNWRRAWDGIKSIFKGFIKFFFGWIEPIVKIVDKLLGTNFASLFEDEEVTETVTVNYSGGMLEDGIIGAVGDDGYTPSYSIPDIGTVGHYALGTSYFKGGLAEINERGGELQILPSGTAILPSDKTAMLINGFNGSLGGFLDSLGVDYLANQLKDIQTDTKPQNGRLNINVNNAEEDSTEDNKKDLKDVTVNNYITIDGNIIGNKEFIDELGAHISRRVKKALLNTI